MKRYPKFKKIMMTYIEEYVAKLQTEARESMQTLLNSASNKSVAYTRPVEQISTYVNNEKKERRKERKERNERKERIEKKRKKR